MRRGRQAAGGFKASSPAVALDAIRLAAAAYLPAAGAASSAAAQGYDLARWWDAGETQVGLFRRDDRAFLVFRGTSIVPTDLLSNLSRPWGIFWAGPGRIHVGYAKALYQVARSARHFADDVASEIPLFAAGHSMGGALATLYSIWCDHRLAGLVTFGAPKPATRRALALRRCPAWRYVTAFDFAPFWPPLVFSHPCRATRLASAAPILERHFAASYIAALEGRT